MLCRPITYEPTTLTLDNETLAQFYDVGGRLVYYVTNLKLSAPYDTPPCGSDPSW